MGVNEIAARAATAGVRCECGHLAQRHELPGFDGECVADGCRCRLYRPRISAPLVAAVPVGRPAPQVARSGIEQLLAQGKRSQSKRTAALVERIEAAVTDLYSRIRAERVMVAAQAAAESAKQVVVAPLAPVAPLPDEDLEVKVEPAANRKRSSPPADKSCDVCGKTEIRNLGAHRYHAHGVRAAS